MEETYLDIIPKDVLYEIIMNLDISDIKTNFNLELILDEILLRKIIHRDFSIYIDTSFISIDAIRNLDINKYSSFKRLYYTKSWNTSILFSNIDLDLSYEDILQIEKFGLPKSIPEIFRYYVNKLSYVYLFAPSKDGSYSTKSNEDMRELEIYVSKKILFNILFYFNKFSIFSIKKD